MNEKILIITGNKRSGMTLFHDHLFDIYREINIPKGASKMQKFWTCIVDGTTGGQCYRHDCESDAKNEAERLARMPQNRNKKVYVMEAISCCELPTEPVTWQDIR